MNSPPMLLFNDKNKGRGSQDFFRVRELELLEGIFVQKLGRSN